MQENSWNWMGGGGLRSSFFFFVCLVFFFFLEVVSFICFVLVKGYYFVYITTCILRGVPLAFWCYLIDALFVYEKTKMPI